MSNELKPCPFCGGEAYVINGVIVECETCFAKVSDLDGRKEAIAAWNRRAGSWQPMAHDDPNNDGPVWVDENGCVCWAGANGETRRLVLHGDMRLCLFVSEEGES